MSTITLANMVTAFQMTSWCMLMFGNWVIGVIEAEVIALGLDKRPPWLRSKCVVANYVTTSAGVLIVTICGNSWEWLSDFSLFHPAIALAGIVVATFVVTVAMEWPLLAWAASLRGVRRSFQAVALANLVTYLTVVPVIFLMTGDYISFMGWEMKPGSAFGAKAGYSILYVDPDGQRIHRIDLGKPGADEVLPATIRPGNEVWQAAYEPRDGDSYGMLDAASFVPPLPEALKLNRKRLPEPNMDFQLAHRLGWPYRDLRSKPSNLQVYQTHSRRGVEFLRDGKSIARLVCDSAFIPHYAWPAGTIIDGDLVVVAFSSRICVVDVASRTVYLFGKGELPLVQMSAEVMADQPTPGPATTRAGAAGK